MVVLASTTAAADDIVAARYDEPTERYGHGVLGGGGEWGALVLTLASGRTVRLVLPESRVFEDWAPRLQDLDGDGAPEVVVVESALDRGARLAVYGAEGVIATTPFIGRPFRWLAPVGAADLDEDGAVEVAYVDRPHLAKILRIWRFDGGALSEVAAADGFTNHRIGEAETSGGVRDCGGRPELILADADWRRVMAVRLEDGRLRARPLSELAGPRDFAAALACEI